eukprot:SAG31_NODE_14127_length_826_cov_0.737276_1_plen_125_part_10
MDDEHIFDVLDSNNDGTLSADKGGITFDEFKQMRANYASHGHVHEHILGALVNEEHGAMPKGTVVKHSMHGKGKVHDHKKGSMFKDHKHALVFEDPDTAIFSTAEVSGQVMHAEYKSSELKRMVL